MSQTVKLTFEGDTSQLESSFDQVGASSRDMEAEVSKAGGGLDSAATKADGLATRASIAAGGIGDLAGALEANGIISEDMAAKAEMVSSSIMGIAGVADLSVIAMEGVKALQSADIVQKGIMIGQNIAHRAGIIATTVATHAMAVAQKVLNAAMRANPIGIIITIIMLLVGAIILLWNKNEGFRRVVMTVWNAIKIGIRAVVQWFTGSVIPAFQRAFAAIVQFAVRFKAGVDNAFRLAKAVISRVISDIRGVLTGIGRFAGGIFTGFRNGVSRAVQFARRVFSAARTQIMGTLGRLRDGIGNIVRRVGDFFRGLGSRITAPFRSAFSSIRSLWNSTVGGFGFTVPSFIPGIGGQGFSIPYMHTGGIVSGARGAESLAVLQAGERVTPFGAGGGPDRVVRVDLGDEIMRMIRKAVRTQGGNVQIVLGSA